MFKHHPFRRLLSVLLCGALLLSCAGCGSRNSASASADAGGSEYTYTGSIDYQRDLANRNQVFRPESARLSYDAGLRSEKRDYTVMVYMTGSNLESQMGNGTKDMMEMKASGIDYEKSNVLVYTGGSRRWMGGVPSDRNCIFDLSRAEGSQIVADTESNADMGAPETLSAFLNFCYECYPADHYALVFWDHGGGPLWGYGSDELFESDSLLLSEMKTALSQTPFAKKKLDWVGFDACLMGSLECMSLWSQYANYYVASEELEPGDGWDYTFLNVLNETTNPVQITERIVADYGAYYEAKRSETYNPDVTLASVDLNAVASVISDMDSISKALADKVTLSYASIQKIRGDTKSFGLVEGAKGEEPYYYDLIDLADFAQHLKDENTAHGDKLLESLSQAVVSQYSNVEGVGGISTYYPFRNKGQYSELPGVYDDLAFSRKYNDFLKALSKQWLGEKSRYWDLSAVEEHEDEWTIKLSDDQLENMTAAYYTVLERVSSRGYWPLMTRYRIEPDENGVLHIPSDPELVALRAAGSERHEVWPVAQLESTDKRKVYRTENTMMTFTWVGTLSGEIMYDGDTIDVAVVLNQTEDQPLQIQTVSAENDEAAFGGKNTVNASHYESIHNYFGELIPARDKNGRLTPFSEWEESGQRSTNVCLMDSSFGFDTLLCSQTQNKYAIQVELEDTSGEFYGSELLEVTRSQNYEAVEETTSASTIEYRIMQDHAEVTNYNGTDQTLRIPETVNGKPVTTICEWAFADSGVERIELPDSVQIIQPNAFFECDMKTIQLPSSLKEIGELAFCHCYYLTEAELPEGVERIGKRAFSHCSNLKRLSLPRSLQFVGEGFAYETYSLEEITLGGSKDGIAQGCVLQDGVVFSTDRKTLLAFPAVRTGQYTVPEGVEIIGMGSFSATQLSKVTFPASLKRIRLCAFIGATSLQAPVFPDGLTEIETEAFGLVSSTYRLSAPKLDKPAETIPDIHLGPNVSYIGEGAFDALIPRQFSVSKDNPYFCTVDGTLCNKEGDAVVSFAMDGSPAVRIPDGIRTLDWNLFQFIEGIDTIGFDDDYSFDGLHIVVPDSVTEFPAVDSGSYCLDKLVLHAPHGSASEAFVENYNEKKSSNDPSLSYDSNLEFVSEEYEETTEAGIFRYQLYSTFAALTAFEGNTEELRIPSEAKGLPVTIIGNGTDSILPDPPDDSSFDPYSFLYEDETPAEDSSDTEVFVPVRKIILPEGVEEIRDNAFNHYQHAISEISLPSTLKVIGNSAIDLEQDAGFDVSTLPPSIEYLGDECLGTGEWVNGKLTIYPSLTYISPKAFAATGVSGFVMSGENDTYTVRDKVFLYDRKGETLLSSLSEADHVDIPQGTVAIGSSAFENAKNTSVFLPDSVREVGSNAFSSCYELNEVHFSNGLEKIGDFAFSSCSLTSAELPEGLVEIGEYAFSYNKALEKLTLPDGLQTIGNSAFGSCPNLTQVTLPESLRSVGYSAFSRDSFSEDEEPAGGMEELHIGKNLVELEPGSFDGLRPQRYSVDEENPSYTTADGMLTNKNKTELISCPAGLTGAVTVPEGIEKLGYGVFYDLKQLTDITIPDSVVEMDTDCFPSKLDDDYNRIYTVTLHCHKDSHAEHFAREEGIPYVVE